jgi:N-acetylglutamate synthase-like GNAT family acetyltransferase
MTFSREGLMENRAELEPIFRAHWQDVTPDFEGICLGFDWLTYAELENMGAVHFIVAREDKKIVGYQMCIIRPHIHSKDSVVASTTFFFMLPEHRKGWSGVNLFRATEASLKSIGVKNLYVGCKKDKNLSSLFLRIGYHEVERTFCRTLE